MLKKVCHVRSKSLGVETEVYEIVAKPTVTYRVETWDMGKKERHKLDFMKMEFLLNISRVAGIDRMKICLGQSSNHFFSY